MRYFLIAGEASGDLHASNLIRALKERDTAAEFCFLGGDLMAEASASDPVIHYRRMAFMGIVNVVLNLRTVLANLQRCKEKLLQFRPDVVILVDYPSFNLRIAKFVKQKMTIPVYYYISPKIWAWKEYRIKSIKRYIDKMYCILPFEVDFYKKHGYEVEYVGNPTMDSVSDFKTQAPCREAFLATNELNEKPVVALLAGSRRQEIAKCLPRMVRMATCFPEYQFVVAGAPGVETAFYEKYVAGLPVVFGQTYALVQNAYAAVVNSGTATLETALIGTPQVVVYHVDGGRFASLLKKILLHIPYVSLVNLIAGKEVVPELVAHLFTDENLKKHLSPLLYDERVRAEQQNGYALVADRLGNAACATNTAKLIYASLQ